MSDLGMYILEGQTPVKCNDTLTWGRFLEVMVARRVAFDKVIGSETRLNAEVSTVFIGLDHSFGEGDPLLFETMVFGGPLDQEWDRYSTWDQAVAGHAAMLAKVKSAT